MRLGAGILKPTRIAFLVLSINMVGALIFTEENFNFIRTPKMYNNYDLVKLGILSSLFIFGLSVGSRQNSSVEKNVGISIREVIKLEKLLFTLVFIGYAIWTSLAITRGLSMQLVADVISLRTNSVLETKALLKGIAGITSLTQISPILSAILGYLRLNGEKWRLHFSFLAVMGTSRALLNAERLSVFEFLVPFLIITLFYSKKIRAHNLFISIAGMPIIFSIFEFTRSWTNYYANNFQGSFIDFATFRLFSYYVTAVNNGFLLIQEEGVGPRHPYYSFNFLYEFPIYGERVSVGNEIYNPREGLITFFKYYSNPEFNNPGGLTSLVLDYGWYISSFYILLVGLIIGLIWRKSISDPRYAFLYCALFLGILELPRYFFFGSSRFFPSLVVGLYILRRRL